MSPAEIERLERMIRTGDDRECYCNGLYRCVNCWERDTDQRRRQLDLKRGNQ